MPYSNIVFIKLFLSLFEEDDRFLYQLNESQQLLYIKMLYMAGSTNNKTPKNIKFICNKINYHHEEACFTADIERMKNLFPGFQERNGFYYFNNFNKLHNFIGNSKGTPKEHQRIAPEKSKRREDKEIEKKVKFLDGVFLTDKEFKQLCADFGEAGANERIKNLDFYIGSKGDKYKSHYKTILMWEHKNKKEDKPQGGSACKVLN